MSERYRLVFYATAAGRCPVRDYIDGVGGREAARFAQTLDLLEETGLRLGTPHVRSLGDKMWELRIVGTLQHRVIYFAATGRRLVLLHAFLKKTRRTPTAELETARRRMADYRERLE